MSKDLSIFDRRKFLVAIAATLGFTYTASFVADLLILQDKKEFKDFKTEFTDKESKTLEYLCSTIISPLTSEDIKLVWLMLFHFYSFEIQENIKPLLIRLNNSAKEKYKADFVNLSPNQSEDVLSDFEKTLYLSYVRDESYLAIKESTLFSYYSSPRKDNEAI